MLILLALTGATAFVAGGVALLTAETGVGSLIGALVLMAGVVLLETANLMRYAKAERRRMAEDQARFFARYEWDPLENAI